MDSILSPYKRIGWKNILMSQTTSRVMKVVFGIMPHVRRFTTGNLNAFTSYVDLWILC